MPGVPSGRGCDACRKQKKKCDQAKPACGRCSRLGIQCAGSGQQRFKFIHQDGTAGGPPAPAALRPLTIVRAPVSRSALIAGNVFSRLRVTDIRFDTSCFGSFLRFLPERIGSNQALDTAADAFATAFTNLHVSTGHSTQALVKHGSSLRALRDALGDPALRMSPDTICAIYLTMLTEGVVREEPGRHAEGMAYVLQTNSFRKWNSRFELGMLKVMCFVVMMESIGNPNIHLDPWLPGLLDRLEPHHMGPGRSSADRYPSLGLRSMAGMARALRDPEKRYEELLAWYEELMDDIERLQHKMKGLLATEGKGGKDHRVCLTELSLGVTAAIAHNRMLQVFHPQDASLREAGRALAEQMIDNGEQSLPHKPLGAAHVVSGLNITWAATDDPKLKARAARIIDEIYDCGFPSADRMREPKWWALKFTDVREQVRKMRSPGGLEGSPEEYRAILHQQCHIQ